MAPKSSTIMLGATLLAAAVEGSIVANPTGMVVPDCSKLYARQWSGGIAVAKQGNYEYTWAFNPCTPVPANSKCNQPPYSGNVYIAEMDFQNPNPCSHQLFCDASPASVVKNSTSGVVTYLFPQCVPSQFGNGPSPRSATVHVVCDSPTFEVDPVVAVKTPDHGYHFTMRVHGPCGNKPTPPTPPAPACPAELAHVPAVFFTQPMNPKGDVYDWGVNLCNATSPSPPMLVAVDSVTGKQTTLDQRLRVEDVGRGWGWEFYLTSSTGPDTGRITVEKAAGGLPCRYLSPPKDGVEISSNGNLGVDIAMTLMCL